MKKKTMGIAMWSALLALVLTGCACKHEAWNDADCVTPRTCENCDATEGEPLGHTWKDATCTAPKTCETCGETEGEPIGHNWKDATCTVPKTCEVCGETEGEALGHDWKEATCTTVAKCRTCGETKSGLAAHSTGSGKCSACGSYTLTNAFIPATLDFVAYGTYGEETSSDLTTVSETREEDGLTYINVVAEPKTACKIDGCDTEVKLRYWEMTSYAGLMTMEVIYTPTDGTSASELGEAIMEEFDLRYNITGSYDYSGAWWDNSGSLKVTSSISGGSFCLTLDMYV